MAKNDVLSNSQARFESVAPEDSRKDFVFHLEALRGVAAIVVIWGHLLFSNSRIDPGYTPTGIWSYKAPAHLSVLVFFILSGYVIGVSHRIPLTVKSVFTYCKKRFVRIYPIYLVCLIFAFFSACFAYSSPVVINHLIMNQGIFVPVISEFAPAWSLTYEIIFYILFIPISLFRLNPILLALATLVLGVFVNNYFNDEAVIISSISLGFTFWLFGLILARLERRADRFDEAWMVSLIFMFLAIDKIDAPITIINKVVQLLINENSPVSVFNQPIISLHDFNYLPYCGALVAAFSGITYRYHRLINAFLIGAPAITYLYYFRNFNDKTVDLLFLPTIFYCVALIFYVFNIKMLNIARKIIAILIPTGMISYGMYIFHYPLLIAIGKINIFAGTPISFIIRLLVFVLITLLVSVKLELKFQPFMRKLLYKP